MVLEYPDLAKPLEYTVSAHGARFSLLEFFMRYLYVNLYVI